MTSTYSLRFSGRQPLPGVCPCLSPSLLPSLSFSGSALLSLSHTLPHISLTPLPYFSAGGFEHISFFSCMRTCMFIDLSLSHYDLRHKYPGSQGEAERAAFLSHASITCFSSKPLSLSLSLHVFTVDIFAVIPTYVVTAGKAAYLSRVLCGRNYSESQCRPKRHCGASLEQLTSHGAPLCTPALGGRFCLLMWYLYHV